MALVHQSAYEHPECCPTCWPLKFCLIVFYGRLDTCKHCKSEMHAAMLTKHGESDTCSGLAKRTKAIPMTALVVWWCIKHCSAAVLPTSLSQHLLFLASKITYAQWMSASSSFQPKLRPIHCMSALFLLKAHRRAVMVSVSCQPRRSPKLNRLQKMIAQDLLRAVHGSSASSLPSQKSFDHGTWSPGCLSWGACI